MMFTRAQLISWVMVLVGGLCHAQESAVMRPMEIGEEKFVPSGSSRAAMVEIRAEATVIGSQIRLKQIARWSQYDVQAMDEMGELVIGRFEKGQGSLTIEISDLKKTLEEAGANLGGLNFCGAISCEVTRKEEANIGKASVGVAAGTVAGRGTPTLGLLGEQGLLPAALTSAVRPRPTAKTLREVLTAELALRLNVPEESLQVRFDSKNEDVLNLLEGQARFEVSRQVGKRLGDAWWDVTIVSPDGTRKVTIGGNARMWQTQVTAAKPMAYKQPIRPEDVAEKRVLIDRWTDEPMVTLEQVIGQEAGRDISTGTILTGKMITPSLLARPGQLVNVVVEAGRIQVKWVAEARESGSYGQAIRVRKPGTRDEFSVMLTGPQQGKLVSPVGEKVAAGQ